MNTMTIRATKRSSFNPLFGGLFLLFSLPFVLVGAYLLHLENRYQTDGVTVQGTVVGKRIEERDQSDSERRSTTYYVSYRFRDAGGKEIRGDDSTILSRWEHLSTNGPIEIQYLREEPSTNRLAQEPDRLWAFVVIGFGGLGGLIGIVSLWKEIKSSRRITRLLRAGHLAEATVTGVEPSQFKINNIPQWNIRFSFQDFKGRTIDAVSENMTPDLASKLKQGDRGKVRYDPNDSSRNMWVGHAP